MTWETKKLKEVCDFQSGLWKGKKEPFISAYVIRNTNFTKSGELSFDDVAELEVESKQLEKRTLQPGDIILEKSGGGERTPVGRVCYFNKESEKPFSLSNFTARLRVIDRNELYPLFLHRFLYALYLSGNTETMQKHSTGIRNLQLTQYKEIDIPLPSLPVQKQIVEKLDAAFADIDKAISATEKNIKNAEALFQSYLNTQFNKEDNLLPLKEVCELIKEQGKHKELPYVGMEDIESSTGRFLGGLNQKEMKSNTFKFNSNHLLYGRLRPYLNKVMLPDFEGHCSTEIFPILVNKNLQKEYLFYWLLNEETVNKINRTSTGTRMPRANFKEVIEFKLNIPGLNLQKEITERIKNIELELNNFKLSSIEKLNQLNSLKSSILNQAFSGELIKDAA